jgi:hypothetical protein
MLQFAYNRDIIRHFNTTGKLYLRNQLLRMYNFPFALLPDDGSFIGEPKHVD